MPTELSDADRKRSIERIETALKTLFSATWVEVVERELQASAPARVSTRSSPEGEPQASVRLACVFVLRGATRDLIARLVAELCTNLTARPEFWQEELENVVLPIRAGFEIVCTVNNQSLPIRSGTTRLVSTAWRAKRDNLLAQGRSFQDSSIKDSRTGDLGKVVSFEVRNGVLGLLASFPGEHTQRKITLVHDEADESLAKEYAQDYIVFGPEADLRGSRYRTVSEDPADRNTAGPREVYLKGSFAITLNLRLPAKLTAAARRQTSQGIADVLDSFVTGKFASVVDQFPGAELKSSCELPILKRGQATICLVGNFETPRRARVESAVEGFREELRVVLIKSGAQWREALGTTAVKSSDFRLEFEFLGKRSPTAAGTAWLY